MRKDGSWAARAALSGAVVLLSAGGSAWGATPTEVLDRLEKQRGRVQTLETVVQTRVREGDRTRVSTVHTWEKRGGKTVKTRVETETRTSAKNARAKKTKLVTGLIVSDGKHDWRETLVGDSVMVFKSKANPSSEFDRLRAQLRTGKVQIKGRESVLKESCVILEIVTGERGGRSKSTYWISEAHGLVLKSIVSRAGSAVTETTTTELKVNKLIADTRFSYTPPPKATVIDTESFGQGRGDTSAP